MDLIIIRHGKPVRVELTEGQGTADPKLSETGWNQAQAVADFLAGEHIDHVVASSMRRAHETAKPLAEHLGLEIELSDDLQESDRNSLAYIPAEEFTEDSEMIRLWRDDPMAIFDEGYEVFRDRVVRGFDHVIATNGGRRVAVFCHGMVIGVFLQQIIGTDPFQLRPDYTGITRVQANSKGMRTVRSVNETAHVRSLIERTRFN